MEDSVTLPAASEYEFVQSTKIDNPHRWDIHDPYIYKVYSVLKDNDTVVDVTETTFGIRSFHFDPDKGFFLNGRPVKLKGFNAHYDFAGLGTAIPDRIHWNLMTAMKKAGFNFYRSSHNPATPERLDVCDRLGILVWDEIERKLESEEVELALVRETITRDRNHPSIILWSLENESPLESTVFGTKIITAATKLAHQLDPTRLTTFAASMAVNKNGYGEAIDVVSYNYHWKRADQDHIDFPHWKIGLLSEFSAARSRRGVYGIENFARADNDSYLDLYWGMVQSMYEMCTSAESYWRRIKARDYLAGGCLWSGMDCWGEGNAWPLISRGDGAVDACLFPKDVYYYFASQWTEKPMVHIFPHWTWKGNEGKPIDIWCYTNCDSAELFVSGQSMGVRIKAPEPIPWQPGSDFDGPSQLSESYPEHLEWKVPYQSGSIKVNGIIKGLVVCTQEIYTAGTAKRIVLTPLMHTYITEDERPPLIADGRDIIVVQAAVVDQKGTLIPTAGNLVNFSVEGPGKIIGVGNGNIASHEPNKASQRKVFNGLCAVIVQSTPEAGKMTIRAESADLSAGELILTSWSPQPVDIVLESGSLQVSAQDTLIVTASVRDKFGSLVASAESELNFQITGPAHFENGSKTITVACRKGKTVVGLKVDQGNEPIIIQTAGKDLKPGRITISAK
jgi:beta-galactosidase